MGLGGLFSTMLIGSRHPGLSLLASNTDDKDLSHLLITKTNILSAAQGNKNMQTRTLLLFTRLRDLAQELDN